MALQIRTPKNAWSSQQVILGGVVLNLELRWQTREAVWCIDIYDANGDTILTGVKLTENTSVDLGYYKPELPEGHLWVLRFESSADKITRDNLGTAFQLVYLTEEEEIGAGLR
jgi:hypothetical protein